MACNKLEPDSILTVDEIAAILLYTKEWPLQDKKNVSLYYQLNAILRDRDRNKVQPFLKYLYLLLSAMSKLPTHEGTVFRGVKDFDTSLRELYKKKKENKQKAIWFGWSSTALNLEQLEQFLPPDVQRTLFFISSKSGRQICKFSFFEKEEEALFLPMSAFEIESVLPQGLLTVVHLKEVNPMEDLLTLFPKIPSTIQPTIPPTIPRVVTVQPSHPSIISPTILSTTMVTVQPSHPVGSLLNPQVGGFIECWDKITNQWYACKIINLSPSQMTIQIHYEGWMPKWDEFLHIHHDSQKIRPISPQSIIGDQFPVDKASWTSGPVMLFGNQTEAVSWGNPVPERVILWDTTYSRDLYMISHDRRIATFFKESSTPGFQDYSLYPVARVEGPFTELFSIQFIYDGYGWFGLGSRNLLPDGFPGYTPDGWMFSTNGKIIHNKVMSIWNDYKGGREINFNCDPRQKLVIITFEGSNQGYKWTWDNLPSEVYFVVSVLKGGVTLNKK